MACFHPLRMYRLAEGGVTFDYGHRDVLDRNGFVVPCGQCFGCRSDRASMWGLRTQHEAQLYGVRNEFVQFTVDDEYMDEVFPNYSLEYRPFQLFMKKLRNRKGDGVRFLAGFEYGGCGRNPVNLRLGRPHIHAALFNCFFEDRRQWKKSQRGEWLYRSDELEELWPYGIVLTGTVTYGSGRYIGEYCMKKVTGKAGPDFYRGFNPYTGEIVEMTPPFSRMSTRPGIGAAWFARYGEQSVREGFVVERGGVKYKIPRYYDKCFDRIDLQHGVDLEFLKLERQARAEKHADNNTPERLAVREVCAIAKRKFNEER